MAERRMFAKSVIGSARFLRMPPTSRLLYYDLGMQADDDGVVEAFSVMRTTGATEDDLKVLASKGFVTVRLKLSRASYSYPSSFRIKFTISMAPCAQSAPLLPAFVPARSMACSMVSVVKTPNMTGMPLSSDTAAIPLDTSAHT